MDLDQWTALFPKLSKKFWERLERVRGLTKETDQTMLEKAVQLYEGAVTGNERTMKPVLSAFFRARAARTARQMTAEQRKARAKKGGQAFARLQRERKRQQRAQERERKAQERQQKEAQERARKAQEGEAEKEKPDQG